MSDRVLRPTTPENRDTLDGFIAALGAFLLWGVLPIYFKAMSHVPAVETVAHRVIWSAVFTVILVVALKKTGLAAAVFRNRRLLLWVCVSTVVITINWTVFIWAIANERLLEVSLGYYINPLVNVLFGTVLLAERLTRNQGIAVGLAAAGVVVLIVVHGTVPWVSLTLAVSFALYTLVRKQIGIDSLVGLMVETLLLTPVAIIFLLWLAGTGDGAFLSLSLTTDLLLLAAGPATAVPLILFIRGAQGLRLSTVGLMQYLAPTMHVVIAVALFGEAFTWAHGITFGLIWTGLALYSFDMSRTRRK